MTCPSGTTLPLDECCGALHPDTRPRTLTLDPDQRWHGLEIVDTDGGQWVYLDGVRS